MFFANSLKHQLRWGILASFICLGCVISTIFFSVYYIDYFDEFKEELIEEKNELVLFGLEKEKGQVAKIIRKESRHRSHQLCPQLRWNRADWSGIHL